VAAADLLVASEQRPAYGPMAMRATREIEYVRVDSEVMADGKIRLPAEFSIQKITAGAEVDAAMLPYWLVVQCLEDGSLEANGGDS
jgi:hypothetical protein